MLAGNLAALGSSFIIAVTATILWPENYTFPGTVMEEVEQAAKEVPSSPSAESEKIGLSDEDKTGAAVSSAEVDELPKASGQISLEEFEAQKNGLKKAFRFALWFSLALTLILIILVSALGVTARRGLHMFYCRSQFRSSSPAKSILKKALVRGSAFRLYGYSMVS